MRLAKHTTDPAIRDLLADESIDDEIKAPHVERAKIAIQARWSEAERYARDGYKTAPVDTHEIERPVIRHKKD